MQFRNSPPSAGDNMPLARSLSLLQRHVLRPACLTTSCTRQAWTKPWNKGDPKLWAQGIFDCEYVPLLPT